MKKKLKWVFVILIFPVIILGEFIRVLHRVGSYKISFDIAAINRMYIKTSDNKRIAVTYTQEFEKCVILIHGYLSSSKRSIMKYGKILHENGFDFVAIDFRNHGMSELSLPVSAGYYERLDIIPVIRWSRQNWEHIFILATSLGSYATGYALCDLPQSKLPDAVVLESFGVDIKIGTRQTLMEIYRFPYILASLITIYAHLRNPVMFQRNIIEDLQKIENDIPILIAHGTKDKIYPPNVIQKIMRKRLSKRNSFIQISGAEHSQLYLYERFTKTIINFFSSHK